MVSTGNRIEARRKALGMSRQVLAKKLKTTRMSVWRVEKGHTQLAADSLPHWAKALKTTAAELVE